MTTMEMAYRKTAVEGSTPFGLLIALYDTLAHDLRRAADAERRNDIPARCREVNHAFTVISYLQDRCEKGDSGELTQQLIGFYASLRRKLILAQAKRSAEMLEEQMAMVLSIRGIWQDIEQRAAAASHAAQAAHAHAFPAATPVQESGAFSCSA
jgi:flagellar biosynthetic protein FliS